MLELLRQGADPHAASNQKRTPLHEACMQGIFMTLLINFHVQAGKMYAEYKADLGKQIFLALYIPIKL